MTEYIIEAPLVTWNMLNGIIYKLKNELMLDPIDNNLIIPSSIRSSSGNPSRLVYWNSYIYSAGAGSPLDLPWVQLSFPRGFFFPTAYSMRGVYLNDTFGYYFATEWNVYGIEEGAENDESKWHLLATNNNTESIYCNIVNNIGGCTDINVGTFTLKNMSTNGYKHLRWRQKVSCCDKYYFATSGLDIYGTFYIPPNYKYNRFSCYCRCAIYSIIFPILLVNFMNEE